MDKEKESINNLPVEDKDSSTKEESPISLKIPEVSDGPSSEEKEKKESPVIEESSKDDIKISVDDKEESVKKENNTKEEPSLSKEEKKEETVETVKKEETKKEDSVSKEEGSSEKKDGEEKKESPEIKKEEAKEVSSEEKKEENKDNSVKEDVASKPETTENKTDSKLEENKPVEDKKEESKPEENKTDENKAEVKETEVKEESQEAVKEEVKAEESQEVKQDTQAATETAVNAEQNVANMEMPAFNLEEEKVDKPNVEGKKTDMNADFSAIFNIESEEVPEVKNAQTDTGMVANSLGAPAEIEVPEEQKVIQKKKDLKEDFNADEKVIFTYEEEKESNPIVVVLFFGAILVFMFFLPVFSKGYSFSGFGGNNSGNGNGKEEIPEDEFFYFKASTKLKVGDLEFSNFVPSVAKNSGESRITFTMSNYGQKVYLFDKKYFLELYAGDQLITYALLHSYEPLAPMASREMTLVINQRAVESTTKIRIEEITPSRYPSVTLREQEGDYDILMCSHLNDKMYYYFLDGKLSKIVENYESDSNNDLEYLDNKTAMHKLWQRYKTIENFESIYIEFENSFKFVNTFELKNIQDKTLSNLNTYKFFKYNEAPNVVAFEMAAQGYVCG